jgi:hypothetical protein
MQMLKVIKVLLPVVVVFGLAMPNCTGGMGVVQIGPPDDGQNWSDGVDTQIACDPDSHLGCNHNYFVCYVNDLGEKECYGQNPDVPGGGDWNCRQEGATLICEGSGPNPGDGNGWTCEDATLEDGSSGVVCRSHAPVPDDGTDTIYDCYYTDDEYRVCEATDQTTTDGDADADEGGGEDADADADEGGGEDADADGDTGHTDCACVAGAVRFCDTPQYCNWGSQVCRTDGLDWGSCDELAAIPLECQGIDYWYSPASEACCIDQGFCCQDMWDLNGDGDTWESLGNCADIVCG